MNKPDSKGALLVFTKPPVLGKVKTRLIPAIGSKLALAIYEELLTKTIDTVLNAEFYSKQIWVSDNPEHPYFNFLKENDSAKLYKQEGEDLGQRMFNAINTALQDHAYVILIGSDCPSLEYTDLIAAVNHLENGADIVLGPTVDGGYYLVGVTKNDVRIFSGIKWGKENVFADTCNNIKQLGWHYETLPKRWDVDRINDLLLYIKQKREEDGALSSNRHSVI